MFLSPNQTLSMSGTKDEFEEANPFLDEEHNELLDEKLNNNYQEEMRDSLDE